MVCPPIVIVLAVVSRLVASEDAASVDVIPFTLKRIDVLVHVQPEVVFLMPRAE